MAKRPKRSPALTDAQTAALVASVANLHHDLVPLMAGLKPQSPDYVALVELSTALQQVIRQTTREDPPWMAPRVWKG
ncbi:MAG: hypothetical protein KUA43_13860 [Hoeflea sp.]|uniref:hypothetical protein n=1 Tax=Hoeflea sp. TaxID=1940281 RepID=UPI001D8F1A10|nr:hypothetical protein [Hoeflea sp.]MBU4531244.1 hypothetical protein [Alphaproteobacteria bacterium]MBU4545693.1 hypothetical protein [Alphaproteobacteria bacterium]MBU4550662.1 hypothetical protein [Alphaproteobacteria bacterium]MBV1724521.1 hypothetical protein [Hoeflea sp.]MBV1760541.1 hypothetical protein [Hoeflea sp.]